MSDSDDDVVVVSAADIISSLPDDHTSSSSPSSSPSPRDAPDNNIPAPLDDHRLPTPDPESPLRSRSASPSPSPPPSPPPPARRPPRQPSQCPSDENVCSICFEPWASGGPHHLCCLPCGHLFGFHCIKTWLSGSRRAGCPTCKHRARVRDLRYLFGLPARLAVADVSEVEAVRKRLRDEQDAHERTKIKLREIRKVADRAIEEVVDLRRRAATAAPTFGGPPGRATPAARLHGPSLVTSCSTNGGSVAVAFDGNAGVLYGEKLMRGAIAPAQRVTRLDIGRAAIAESSRVASQRRVNAIAVCTFESTSSRRYVAVAAAERRLRILSTTLNQAAEVECDGVPLSTAWLQYKPNWVVVGTVDGRILTFDVRHMGLGPLYNSEIARGGARAVHSFGECVVDGESVVVAGTAGGVFGLSYDGYLDVPTVTEIGGARAPNSTVCGVSINDGLIAVSSRQQGDMSKRGLVAVHEGLVRDEHGALKVKGLMGAPLQGHVQALPFGDVGVLGAGADGEPMVMGGDTGAKGGVRMWSAGKGDGSMDWEGYEVAGEYRGDCDMVRATAAMRLPRRARLRGVPTGTEGLFACVSNGRVRVFGAGWYR